MANLQDNIRVSTQVDMQQLDELILKYKDLKVNVTNVAAAARAMAEIQKAEIKSILAAEQVAENERDGRSERRRLNKIANIKAETQSELDAIKITDAASKAKYNEEIRSIALYNAQMKQKALETRNAQNSSNGLFNSLNSLTKIRSELITLFGAYSIGSFAQQMVEAQSKVESFQLGMKNLLGEKFGAKLTDDLKKFTVETPLNFENVIDYTNKLVGAFKATGASSREIQEQVTPILESLGNTAAALGGGDRLGRLIYAFTQVQATGRLMGTEVRQITETGFPLLAVMAQQSGKSVQELQKDISDGKVGFEQFQKAILSAGKEGGVFAGAMDIMANTVQGRIDKMKETVFFALANIGKQFNESAKNAVNFASSIVDGFFGTENATKRTIEYIQQLVLLGVTLKLVAGYEAALATGKKILNTLELAGNVIRTQMAVVTATAAGNTLLLAEAEVEAAAATRAFSAAVSSSTLGAFLFVIGAAIGAYELYKSNLEEVETLTYDNIKATDSDVKALVTKQSQLNATAKSALSLAEGTEGYRLQVGQLIKKYPEYFGHLDAEKASHDDIRKALFLANNEMERKIKLMVQEKLAEKLADRSADLKLQIAQEEITAAAILDKRKEYQQKQLELKKKGLQDEYQEQLGAYETTVNALDQSNKKLAELRGKDAVNKKLQDKATNDLLASQQEDYRIRHEAIVKKWNNKEFETRKQFTDAIKALDLEFGFSSTKAAESTGKAKKDAAEKALKYQKESAEQALIMDEIFYLKEQESSRDNEIKIRTLQKQYDELRLKDSVGSANKKAMELTDIENDFQSDIADIKRRWNAKERVASEKAEKEKNKVIEDEAKKSAERLWDIIVKRINDEQKAEEDAAKERKKFEDEVSKETIKIKTSEQKLKDKILLLEKLSKAKTSEDIVRIEKDASLEIIELARDRNLKETAEVKAKLDYLKQNGQEQTEEYRDLYKKFLELQKQYNEISSDLMDEETENVKKSIKKREDIMKGMVNGIKEISSSILDDLGSEIDSQLSKADNSIDKFFLNRKKKDLEEIKSFVGIATKLVSGDIAGAATQGVVFAYTLIKNTFNQQAEWEKAVLERQIELYKQYASSAKASIAAVLGSISDSTNIYQDVIPKAFESVKGGATKYLTVLQAQLKSLQAQSDELDSITEKLGSRGNSVDDYINKEIKYAENIKKLYSDLIKEEEDRHSAALKNLEENYSKSKSDEDSLYNSKKDNIDKIYNDEVKRINDSYNEAVRLINARYDLEAIRASQKYDAETLAILQAGSKQLEALITNEISLNSVRDEFAKKRQFILDSYALANRQITSDMTQEEIDGINNAIKARDEALGKLQKQYNDELTFIVNSEGQKRKEYSDTEKIQNEINDRLDKASIKFNADEIQRVANKNIELKKEADKKDAAEVIALSLKNNAIEIEEARHKGELLLIETNYQNLVKAEQQKTTDNLIRLNKQMEADLSESYTRLINALSSEITRYGALLTSINDTTTSEYKALQEELQKLIDKYKELGGVIQTGTGTPIAPIIITGPRGFEKGTDNTSISLSGQPIVDNRGGKPAILHPDEAVFSKANMSEMTKALGYRPSRDEVIEKFKMGIVNMKLSHSPYVIPKLESKGIGNVDKVVSELKSVANEMRRIQTPQVIMNERGIKTYLLGVNSKVQAKLDRFK